MNPASPGMPDASVTRIREQFRRAPGAMDHPERTVAALVRQELPLLAEAAVPPAVRWLLAEFIGLGSLEHLLADPAVTDVLVNGPGHVWVDRRGRLERTSLTLDRPAIERCIERLLAPLGLHADRTRPVVDARLGDGTRVSVVLPPVAVDGPVLALRRHRSRSVPLDEFAAPPLVRALRSCVRDRANVVVYGPTGAGKTT
ncbi:MAG: ATPase, T2SS/T4P/T4SS family, partial [Actinomycetes bacterium]